MNVDCSVLVSDTTTSAMSPNISTGADNTLFNATSVEGIQKQTRVYEAFWIMAGIQVWVFIAKQDVI